MTVPGLKTLAQKKCKPCEGGVAPFTTEQAEQYIAGLKAWKLAEDRLSISAQYVMKDFSAAFDFMDRIREVAEADDHHPDLHLTGYRKLRIELATHAIGGLSENDFILAAKIEQLPKVLKQ